jgi:hypothetical protein
MTATTKVYRVTTYDEMLRHYHFPTKSAAKAFVRQCAPDHGDGPEIDTLVVPLNARGIAEALDDFIAITCANEG